VRLPLLTPAPTTPARAARARAARALPPSALAAAVVLAGALVATAAAAPVAAAAAAASTHRSRAVCTKPRPGFAHCDAVLRLDPRTGLPQRTAAPAGLSPADIEGAYGLPSGGGAGRLVAIVDAYDDPHAEADLASYRATFGLPACTRASGCLQISGQDGAPGLPAANPSWSEEISLDLDAVSAACPGCRIALVEATTSSLTDLGAAVRTAAALPGVVAISNSYGGAISAGAARLAATWSAPGAWVVASSGDGGYGVEVPAALPSVVAVGGTTLTLSGHARRRETAWSGSGSGCSTLAKPAWQRTRSCAGRAVADVAADADPATGLAVYDTVGSAGGWLQVGGTSLAAPLVAGVHAQAGSASADARALYAPDAAVADVTSGRDGTCTPKVLCTAGAGWDGPTGVGSPDGLAGW